MSEINKAMAKRKGLGLLGFTAAALGGYAAYKGTEALYNVGKLSHERSKEYMKAGTASPFQNSRFMETREIFTMRQTAMAAIGQTRGNLDNYMIGNEAGMLHR